MTFEVSCVQVTVKEWVAGCGGVFLVEVKVYMTVFFMHVALPPGSTKIFHTHLEENLARSFQNVFGKCSKGLKSCIFKKSNFS